MLEKKNHRVKALLCISAGDDLMRCVDLYNQTQSKWFEEMVTTSMVQKPSPPKSFPLSLFFSDSYFPDIMRNAQENNSEMKEMFLPLHPQRRKRG